LTDRLGELIAARENVLLVGESGAGKTYLVRTLPLWVWPSRIPGQMRLTNAPGANAPTIIETNAAHLVQGCHYVADLENKLVLALNTLRGSESVLFIENLHECLGMGASTADPHNDLANLVLLAAEQGVRLISTTTPQGLALLRSRNPRLVRRLTRLDVPEPEATETAEIMKHHLVHLESWGTAVDPGIVECGMRLVGRYLPGEPPMAAFLDLVGQCAASDGAVGDRGLRRAIADKLGVRPCFVGLGGAPTYPQLADELEAAVCGQPHAVAEVADAILCYSGGLKPVGRPIGSLLLVGPSGVGKTTLALTAARLLSGAGKGLIRFDLSEYADPGAHVRLLDDSERSLVGRLLAQPAGVLLLDEIEKAHPFVRRLLLQALGEARLTSENGRTVSLENQLVMMTSNVAARRWARGGDQDKTLCAVFSELAEEFPTEFLGRVRVVPFRPLSGTAAFEITVSALDRLNEMPGVVERELQLIWTDELVGTLVRAGISRTKGARGLQGAVQSLVVSPLARWLAENSDASGGVVMLAPRCVDNELVSLAIDWVSLQGAEWETVN
jgi:ATP-dependent Clp protease ATP-binding subunit ClpC